MLHILCSQTGQEKVGTCGTMASGAQGCTHRPQPVHTDDSMRTKARSTSLAARFDFLATPRDVDGRAADVDAVAATGALVFQHFEGLQLVVILDQHAGLVGDDHRHIRHLHFFAQGFEQNRQFIGVDDV
jgi:hypothetical protein